MQAPSSAGPECRGYPLSSNLLALFSGSFYGTPGSPETRKESADRPRPTTEQQGEKEARRFEERQPALQQPEEEEEEEERKKRKKREKSSGGERRRWRIPKWRRPVQDKISLCARAQGPGAKGSLLVSVSYFANPAIIFYSLLPFHSALSACPSFFALSLFGLPLLLLLLLPRLFVAEREGSSPSSLDASLWMNIQPSLSRLLCTTAHLLCPRRGIRYANIIFTRLVLWRGKEIFNFLPFWEEGKRER